MSLLQLLETVVGLGVIGLVVKGSQPFPKDVFQLSLECDPSPLFETCNGRVEIVIR
jgi:hypothetical protein